jgi:hypothetical protein
MGELKTENRTKITAIGKYLMTGKTGNLGFILQALVIFFQTTGLATQEN